MYYEIKNTSPIYSVDFGPESFERVIERVA